MAGLEDLAALLVLGDKQKAAIAADDPYSDFAGIGKQVIGQAVQAQDAPLKDRLAVAILGGLGGGLMGGISDNYRARAGQAYQDTVLGTLGGGVVERPSVLGPSIFQDAQSQGNLFRSASILRQADQANEAQLKGTLNDREARNAIDKEFAKAIAENPRNAEKIMAARDKVLGGGTAPPEARPIVTSQGDEEVDKFIGLLNGQGIGAAVPTPEPEKSKPPKNGLGFKSLEERRADKFKYYTEEIGMPEIQAVTASKDDLLAETTADKKSFEKIGEVRSKATDLLAMADTVENALGMNINTGFGAGVQSALSGIVGGKQAQGAELLNSIKAKVVGMARVPGAGSTSDFEARQYIMSGPSLDKSEETNLEIARRMRQLGERNRDYADFVDKVRDMGGTIQKADQLWSSYERANPLWVKQEDGSLVPNPKITPVDQFDFTGQATAGGATPPTNPTGETVVGPDGKKYRFVD